MAEDKQSTEDEQSTKVRKTDGLFSPAFLKWRVAQVSALQSGCGPVLPRSLVEVVDSYSAWTKNEFASAVFQCQKFTDWITGYKIIALPGAIHAFRKRRSVTSVQISLRQLDNLTEIAAAVEPLGNVADIHDVARALADFVETSLHALTVATGVELGGREWVPEQIYLRPILGPYRSNAEDVETEIQ